MNRYPLIKLPSETQTTLFLIREELKSRKLFNTLHEAGLSESYFQPHLDNLILHELDMNDGTDETFEMYDAIIEKRSRKIKDDHGSLMKQALKVYHELLSVRRAKFEDSKILKF